MVSLEPNIYSYSVRSILKVSQTDLNEPWYSLSFDIELFNNGLVVGWAAFLRWTVKFPM